MAKDKNTSVYFDREKLKFVNIQDSKIQELEKVYSDVNVQTEIKKMSIWLASPRGKDRVGNMNFILNWLGNSSTRARVVPDDPEVPTPLRPFLDNYVKDLWKDREHILLMNQKSS